MAPGGESWPMIHVNVSSAAGGCTVGTPAFFRYMVRLTDQDVKLSSSDKEELQVLAAIPHALEPEEDILGAFGRGWRIVPPRDSLDWTVLEASPRRLRNALEFARNLLWTRASELRISAREIASIEEEFDALEHVIHRAEVAGVTVNVSYVT